MSVAGGTPLQITQDVAHRPVVSADGKTIACFMPNDGPGQAKLALLDFANGRLLKQFKSKAPRSLSALRWSPDNQALTYVVTINGAANIWSQPLAGGEPVALTDWKSDAIYGFDWAKDGRLVCERGSVLAEVVLIRESPSAKR